MSTPLVMRDAVEWLEIAANTPAPAALYKNLWHEGQFACLIGDNPDGTTEAALRIAETVAESRRVLFIDCKRSLPGFAGQCTVRQPGKLIRAEIDLTLILPADVDSLMDSIEKAIVRSEAPVCVIDSLTWLCEWYCKARSANVLVQKLRAVGRRLGVSVLIAAAPRKRAGKDTRPADLLPLNTRPYIDAVIPPAPQSEESEVPEKAGKPESAGLSELSGKSELSEEPELSGPSKQSAKSGSAAPSRKPRPPRSRGICARTKKEARRILEVSRTFPKYYRPSIRGRI